MRGPFPRVGRRSIPGNINGKNTPIYQGIPMIANPGAIRRRLGFAHQ